MLRVEAGGRQVEGVTALAQNSDPYTYFASRPLRVCEGIAFDDGTLSLAVLRRAAQRDAITLSARLLSERLSTAGHRQIVHLDDVTHAQVRSLSVDAEGRARTFPLQVDGDYIGEHGELDLGIEPGALTVVA